MRPGFSGIRGAKRRASALLAAGLALAASIAGAAPRAHAEGAPLVRAPLLERVDRYIEAQHIDRDADGWRLRVPPPPALVFDPASRIDWVLETNLGTLRFRLFADIAPAHVANAIYLSRLGFYDGLLFHRIVPDFVAQGGDPLGDGRGGPAYRFAGEFKRSSKRGRLYRSGMLAAANAGPGTDGSQFFVSFRALPALDYRHTVYGELIDGRAALRRIEASGSIDTGRPSRPVRILSARVELASPPAPPPDAEPTPATGRAASEPAAR